MTRYNIDTTNGHLIQIDLTKGSWTVNTEDEVIYLTVFNYNASPEEKVTVPMKKKDLEQLSSYITNMLPK